MREDPGERTRRRWQESLRRIVDGIAGLTAVDGATIITDQYELLAFGAKIVRRKGSAQVAAVTVTEPIEGTAALVAEPGQLEAPAIFQPRSSPTTSGTRLRL